MRMGAAVGGASPQNEEFMREIQVGGGRVAAFVLARRAHRARSRG